MKKFLLIIVLFLLFITTTSCRPNVIVVYTETGFAPFEYVKNAKIVGVDIDIMNLVGEKLGKKVIFENAHFNTIIDAVSQGKLVNVGAAGLSITDERKEKVDFSKEYYQATLYAIYNKENVVDTKIMSTNELGIYWSSLRGKKGIGVQTGTTADLFLDDEMKEGNSLYGVKKTSFSSLSVACEMVANKSIDFLIIDELPAKKLVSGNDLLSCVPIYYQEEVDLLAYDSYAICVTKGQTELLDAINEVIDELLMVDETGINGIQKLVNKHLGL